jgi:uncharacterized protein (TIGR02284 family)
MSQDNDDHIRAMNSLIETVLDSAEGYREAAHEAKSAALKHLFEERALRRRQMKADLQVEVRSLGGEPADDGTILAAAHRVFLNLKHRMTGSDESVVAEVESGEDYLKGKFEDALDDDDLPKPQREAVHLAYEAIKLDHDRMRDLKSTLNRTA